jgi:ATP-dependent DNA helicase RecG
MNAEPARLIIYSDRVETLNPNNPKNKGQISPDNFTPFSKNPLIAKFFTQLGWVDELGSGVLNVTNYLKAYSGKEPQFIEDNTFKTIIPLDEGSNKKIEEFIKSIENIRNTTKLNLLKLIFLIIENEGKKIEEYSIITSIPKKTIERYIKILRENNIVKFIGEIKAKNSGYFLTEEFMKSVKHK